MRQSPRYGHRASRGSAPAGLLLFTFLVAAGGGGVGAAASQSPAGLPPALPQSRMAGEETAVRVQATPPPQGEPRLQPLPVTRLQERDLPPEMDGQRFTLSISEPQPIRDLLLLLVGETKLSVIVAPDVDASFAGEIKDVTLREALDLVLPSLGLSYSVEGRVIRVFKRRPETRIFNIDYVATLRSGNRSISASTGAGGAGVAGAGAGVAGTGATATGGAGGTAAAGGGSSAGVSGVESGDIYADLANGIRNLLSEDARFNLDRKASLLQVIDFPENLQRVEFYLENVMRRVQRQVLIEAKVVEVELRDQFATGINWSLILGSEDGNHVRASQSLAPASGIFNIGVTVKGLNALLTAFETQGKVNVLSSPRVTAMNNEPALMRVGTQDVYFVTTTQVDPQSGRILQTAVVPQTITEGVVLSVTPQISSDGMIHMSISPSVTERTGQATSRLGDSVPIISVRETDTLVRTHQGETVVIAGLMQDRVNDDVNKVPILGDLPKIGSLFRRTEQTRRKTDLVILLTATVLSHDQRASDAVRDVQRIQGLQSTPLIRKQ